MRVEAYWNIHKGLYSIRALEGPRKGRVILHTEAFILGPDNGTRVQFVVQQGGRRKVLRDRRKNVHAFVRGELYGADLSLHQGRPEGEWFDDLYVGHAGMGREANELVFGIDYGEKPECWRKVAYNPYTTTHFQTNGRERVDWASFVVGQVDGHTGNAELRAFEANSGGPLGKPVACPMGGPYSPFENPYFEEVLKNFVQEQREAGEEDVLS